MPTKSLFSSKTFWLAVVQTAVAAVAVFTTSFPEWAGVLLVCKSFLDVILRMVTDTKIA